MMFEEEHWEWEDFAEATKVSSAARDSHNLPTIMKCNEEKLKIEKNSIPGNCKTLKRINL